MPSATALMRTASMMSKATLAALAAISVAYVALWLDFNTARATLGEMLPGISAEGVTMTQLWLGSAPGLVPVGLLAAALWELYGFFRLYRTGDPFPRHAGERLKRFGLWMIGLAIASLFVRCAASVLFSWHLGEGKRHLAISISSGDIVVLLFGGLVLMIGDVLAEARRVAEENRMFV